MQKVYFGCTSVLVALPLIFGGILATSHTSATDSPSATASANAAVIVPAACTLTAVVNSAHSAQIPAGTYQADIGSTTFTTICNDAEGYAIYAVGNANNEYGNNKLLATINGSLAPTYDINTGTNTSGTPSSWAMKLATAGSTSIPTIVTGFSSYHAVPSTNTKVVTYASATNQTTGSSFTATYAANIAGNQPAGNYNGRVKYTLVHPQSADAPLPPLYDLVANMSKGTQTAAQLRATITKPTSSNPSTDTSNSGVYEYDASVFGTASDASNDHTIYYYRGILDNDLDGTSSTYGSNGDGSLYPNYVKLGDTCWRIVRTTGSGGVKMVYNGLYSSGTTTNSCANSQDNAQITTQVFGLQGGSAESTYWYRNINRVGYTFNNDSSIQDSTTDTSVDTVFGSNSNYSTTNTTNSNIKDYIENTWFTSSDGISAYESLLESSAGYCNDRTAYSDNTTSTALTTVVPYSSFAANTYFGAYSRNNNATNAGKTPSLTCPRNVVDLYTTSSASDGNKQLSKPVALLTADELSFAGSGKTTATQGSTYNYNSFARSGSVFWLLSPSYRVSGNLYGFYLQTGGYLNNSSISNAHGVRPAISLKSGTTPASGTGTAVDPWVIAAPSP